MKVAEITLPSRPGHSPKTKIIKSVKFKCTRCGTFCCHLGAPEFTTEDFKVIQKKFGKSLGNYIEKREIKSRGEDYLLPYSFKSNPKSGNGSECIFLKYDKKGKSKCTCYKVRPLLCRTFPFVFKQISGKNGNKINIEVIPCPGLRISKRKK